MKTSNLKEYYAKYYQENKEKKKKQGKALAKANPEKVKEYARKARLKRDQNGKNLETRIRWEKNHREYVLWNAAKQRCKKSGINFDIKVEDILIPEICPLLNIKINRDQRGRMQKNSPSLDRIIPEKGYVKGNIQVISWQANRIKCDASIDELLTFSANVQKIFGKINEKEMVEKQDAMVQLDYGGFGCT